jgi:hypothetical protein
MDTLTSQSYSQNKWLKIGVVVLAISWMSAYPIYMNYYRGYAMEQFTRFQDFKAGKSMFFNPWQYRVLCPVLVEGIYKVADATVFNLVDFSKIAIKPPDNSGEKNEQTKRLIKLSEDPTFIKYTIVFAGFRFLQHLMIFILAWLYFSHFSTSSILKYFALMIIAIVMGNAVTDSDLSFNTYMDVILYLCAGLVIVKSWSPWWILLITTVGAFNRETSLLIPVIYFFCKADYSRPFSLIKTFFSNRSVILSLGLSTLFFVGIFVAIRMHYGYVPATRWRVSAGLPMLKLNLFSVVSIKSYMEMFGVIGIMPLICIYYFKKIDSQLRIIFLVLVPAWFAVHFWSVVCYQSRLFLVPTVMVFLPAIIYLIERQLSTKEIR